MAQTQTFKRFTSRNIGNGAGGVRVGNLTVPGTTSETILGLNVCNNYAGRINVSVWHDDGVNKTNYVVNAEIPAGDSLVVIGNEQKQVLITGDGVFVQVTSAAGTVDAILACLEIAG